MTAMTATWTALFPDGTTLTADTPEDLLDAWRTKSWHGWTASEWPKVLAKRAFVWSGTIIDTDGTAADLLAACDKAWLIRLTVTPTGRSK